MSDSNEFRLLQKDIGANNSALSLLLGVSVSTIEKRRAGAVKIPKEAVLAMRYIKEVKNANA